MRAGRPRGEHTPVDGCYDESRAGSLSAARVPVVRHSRHREAWWRKDRTARGPTPAMSAPRDAGDVCAALSHCARLRPGAPRSTPHIRTQFVAGVSTLCGRTPAALAFPVTRAARLTARGRQRRVPRVDG